MKSLIIVATLILSGLTYADSVVVGEKDNRQCQCLTCPTGNNHRCDATRADGERGPNNKDVGQRKAGKGTSDATKQ